MPPIVTCAATPGSAAIAPLAVLMTSGKPRSSMVMPAAAAVDAEIAVVVAPLSISIRRVAPLIEPCAQKWPASALGMRIVRPEPPQPVPDTPPRRRAPKHDERRGG